MPPIISLQNDYWTEFGAWRFKTIYSWYFKLCSLCSHHQKFDHRQGIESSGVSLKKLPVWVRTLWHASFCFSSIFSWTFLNQITLLCDSMALYFSHYVYIECATITAAVNQKGTKNGFVLCMREIMRTLARIFSGPMWRKCHVQYKLNNKVCYVLTMHITRANCRSVYIVQVTVVISTLRFYFILKRPHVAWSRSYSSFRQISCQIKVSRQIEFDKIFPTNFSVCVWGEGGGLAPCPPVVKPLDKTNWWPYTCKIR